MLNHKTLTLLANTLAPKVAEKILLSEEFIECLMEMIPGIVDKELGEMDEDLHFDLSMMVMDRLTLKALTVTEVGYIE